MQLTEKEIEIIEFLIKHKEELLMQAQGNFCCEKSPKTRLVYKSPNAYELGKMIEEYINDKKV